MAKLLKQRSRLITTKIRTIALGVTGRLEATPVRGGAQGLLFFVGLYYVMYS